MNVATIVGRLTRDPELRTTTSGIASVSFTVAVDRRFKNASGEREADFISCKAWRQTAEFIDKYFTKGMKIGLVGTIQTGKYDKDGRTIYTTDVVVDQAHFVESKNSDGGGYAAPNTFAATTDNTDLPFDL